MKYTNHLQQYVKVITRPKITYFGLLERSGDGKTILKPGLTKEDFYEIFSELGGRSTSIGLVDGTLVDKIVEYVNQYGEETTITTKEIVSVSSIKKAK